MTRLFEDSRRHAGRVATALQEVVGSRWGAQRIVNAAVGKLQQALGMSYLVAMPTQVAIEVTNACDGGCLLCPVGQGRKARAYGRMSWDRFRRLVDQISGYARFVGLYNWGEPMLHPRIYEMIRLVADRGIYTKISSNLHPFKPEDSDRLIAAGLNELAVSLHGLSEQSFRAYQPRHELESVLRKVQAIVRAKRKLASARPDIHLGFIVTRDNEHEVERLGQFAESLGVGYLLEETSLNLRLVPYDRDMHDRGLSQEALRPERLELARRWLPRDRRFVNPWYQYVLDHDGALPEAGQRFFACISPWTQVVICWDGDVNLCCGSYEPRHSVGNVFDEPLSRIWNNASYRAARRSLAGRGQSGLPPVLCDECPGMLL